MMPDSDLTTLAQDIEALTQTVRSGAAALRARWEGLEISDDFRPSAENLAAWLALRAQDLRPLQERLMQAGLSSLGRAEGRVLPALQALGHVLSRATGWAGPEAPTEEDFFAGQRRIAARADALLGRLSPESPVRMMVTLPSEAGLDRDFLVQLARTGVEAVRINCAHDDAATWGRMIDHVDAAAEVAGRRMRVLMDLPGPKIRTGETREGRDHDRLRPGDDLAITRPGRLRDVPKKLPAVECTLAAALNAASVGHRIFLDDGKVATQVETHEDWGLLVRVQTVPEERGYKLKSEKGVNFPDSALQVPALTDEDRALLPFIAEHADAVEFSFVQTPEDVADLQEALARLRPDWQRLGLVLKIETARALRNLPDMLVRAAGRQPTAVMIARGDLAVEIGFSRLAEIQEEILWICEAAQVPVIWATQVMESYLKSGVPTRGEMTDLAMAARAECVMLNKGPHLLQALPLIDQLLMRMSGHVSKKTHLLRPLAIWGEGAGPRQG